MPWHQSSIPYLFSRGAWTYFQFYFRTHFNVRVFDEIQMCETSVVLVRFRWLFLLSRYTHIQHSNKGNYYDDSTHHNYNCVCTFYFIDLFLSWAYHILLELVWTIFLKIQAMSGRQFEIRFRNFDSESQTELIFSNKNNAASLSYQSNSAERPYLLWINYYLIRA